MSSFNKIPAVLPKLPYEYNALEPSISATIMVRRSRSSGREGKTAS